MSCAHPAPGTIPMAPGEFCPGMKELTLAVLGASPLPLEFVYGAAFPVPQLRRQTKCPAGKEQPKSSSLDDHYEDIKWKHFRNMTVP